MPQPPASDPTSLSPSGGVLSRAEEASARGLVAAHRARLEWLLRVPEWAALWETGIVELGLPGQRQGITFAGALAALPLEFKWQLVRWAMEHFRSHLSSVVARRLARLAGVERFNDLDLEDLLTARQWMRLREQLIFRLGQEHRRYKHAQQLLFTGYRHLIDPVVNRTVFSAAHRADCAQEGAIGLLHAIDHVDEGGHNLASYAMSWIQRHVRNFLIRQRLPVHVPVNLISEAVLAGSNAAGRDDLGFRHEKTEAESRTCALVLECLRHPSVSLDEPMAENAPTTIADSVADVDAESIPDAAARADLREAFSRHLGALTDKQREVIILRYGLDGGAARSLADIARVAGISHQQVSMREKRALERLESLLSPIAAEVYDSA